MRATDMTLTVTVNRQKFHADALTPLRTAVRDYIDAGGYGYSEIGATWRVTGHSVAARISYNGRFWDASDTEVFAEDN